MNSVGITALAAGVFVLAALWLGPLPQAVGHSFLAHMVMHVGVLAVATPMLALGLPPLHARLPFGMSPCFTLAASLLELVVVWAWHTPGLHAVATGSATGLVLEQASFFACGLLLWSAALHPLDDRSEHRAASVLSLLLTSMHMTLLGALIALAPRPLYHDGHGGGIHALDPLQSQQVGGAVMLLAAGTIYLAAGLRNLKPLIEAR